MIGRLLRDRYEILERVGGGGMALVYKARCTYLNRTVAVKILRPQYATDEEFVRRFRREAQAAASLSHPNIVSIYDVGHEQGLHFIVMEYVSGPTLKDVIQRGRLDPLRAADIAAQICEALEHAHAGGVIHRDIKPHNILLSGNRVKVTDFGIARAASAVNITSAGTVLGSVKYLSPEQARGGFAGERSDLYSLGVVLYEMVTGSVPFKGETPISIAMQHVEAGVTPPRRLAPQIPERLERVVLKAMQKDPLERYHSARDMLRELQLFLNEEGKDNVAGWLRQAPVEPQSAGGPMVEGAMAQTRQPTRRWWPTAFIWLLVVGILVGAAVYGFREFQDWLNVPTVEVPDVQGKSLLEAERSLSQSGLRWSVVAERDDDLVPANHVIEQDPPPGETVRQGRSIELTVSRGPRLVEGGVPDVTNIDYRTARVILEGAGLEVGVERRVPHDTVPVDCVVSQNPRAGATAAVGSSVDLEISLGPVPVLVPDFSGQTLDTVRPQLGRLKLTEGEIVEENSDRPPGVILRHTPAEGEEVSPGTAVSFVVSIGPLSTVNERRIVIKVPSDGPERQEVRVELQDTQGTRVVHDAVHDAGESFQVPVQFSSVSVRVRVYIEGTLQYEQVLTRDG